MIKSISVTNHSGETLKCVLDDPGYSGFSITSIEGLVPGKSTLNVKDIVTLDGGFFQYAKLPSRNIVLTYIFHDFVVEDNRPYIEHYRSIEEARQIFYNYFVIMKQIAIEIETDLHIYKIEGYVESNEPEIFSDMEGAQVSIICPNPYFKLADGLLNPDGSTEDYVFKKYGFEFPFSNPVYKYGDERYSGKGMGVHYVISPEIEFGNISSDIRQQKTTIRYDGDVDTGVIFRIAITGNMTSAWEVPYADSIDFLYHGKSTTEEVETINRFSIRDFTRDNPGGLKAGDELEISTMSGNKYAILHRNGQTINVFHYLSIEDDWIKLRSGDNAFTVKVMTTNTPSPPVAIRIIYPILCAGV